MSLIKLTRGAGLVTFVTSQVDSIKLYFYLKSRDPCGSETLQGCLLKPRVTTTS